MIARVAQFGGINVEAAKATMDEAEAILGPMLQALPGYSGALQLLDDGGSFISISFFDTAENAEAAEPTFDTEMPAKLGHLFAEWAGTRSSTGLFEVVADSRG
ncbi:MAG TPA: hypothetical protein VGM80_05545 [Gaiellaceae bacterium]|jgi:hypothetical protein